MNILKSKLSKKIVSIIQSQYTEKDHSNFDLRVNIEAKDVLISCRVTCQPLYYRLYRKCGMKGSLKPTIAAALCVITNHLPGQNLVDNFCGTGTILCEVVSQKLNVNGGILTQKRLSVQYPI
ncbi:MAG: hypothetical protein ACFFAH_02035 [Promethearchaeota archaeon]